MDSIAAKLSAAGEQTIIDLGSGQSVAAPLGFLACWSAVLHLCVNEVPGEKRTRDGSGQARSSTAAAPLQDIKSNPMLCDPEAWLLWMSYTVRLSDVESEARKEVRSRGGAVRCCRG